MKFSVEVNEVTLTIVPNKRGCGNKLINGRGRRGGLENILKINNWGGWNKKGVRGWKIENVVF